MLRAIAIGLVLSLVLVGAWYGLGMLHKPSAPPEKKEAESFTDTTFPLLAAGWNPQDLLARSTPTLTVDNGKIENGYAKYRGYGAFVSAEPSNCGINGPQDKLVALCSVKAKFAQGAGFATLTLQKVAGDWKIARLNVGLSPQH